MRLRLSVCVCIVCDPVVVEFIMTLGNEKRRFPWYRRWISGFGGRAEIVRTIQSWNSKRSAYGLVRLCSRPRPLCECGSKIDSCMIEHRETGVGVTLYRTNQGFELWLM